MNECLTCKHRGSVPNSRHSSCKHPIVEQYIGNHEDLMLIFDVIVNKHKIPWIHENLKVVLDEDAFAEGWASWPFNFDPIWLKSCTGYEGDE